MFSATVSESNSAPDWKTIVTRRRISASWSSFQSVMSSPATSTRPESGAQKSKNMLQRYRLPHAAAPHDHASLSMVDEEADVVEHQVIVKSFADIAEFDEVARRGRLCVVQGFARPCWPAIVDDPARRSKSVLVAQASSLSGFDFCSAAALKTRQAEACPTKYPCGNLGLGIRHN